MQWEHSFGTPFIDSAEFILRAEGVRGGTKRELERVAWDALDEWADDPAEAARNVARERDRFNLDVETAIAFFPCPIGVQAPEEAVLFAGTEGALFWRAGRDDFSDLCAARSAGAVEWIETGENDVVGGIEHDDQCMLLTHAHRGLKVVVMLGKNSGLENLRCETLRVGGEVFHQAFETCCIRAGDEGSAPPVMEECPGKIWQTGWSEVGDDRFAATEARGVLWREKGRG